ncbi:hypothetical protein F511_41167 [Dorcoceras hygrometricum]|uniref:Uncharacterized protein n=1 Tax=Dorcoceras hygrometricum TaxID=472368 RepID=A0A2Z7AKL2_9LAMI|nr:hypothetical protein F511_41167 [Dorcoceras hygrometricum]
MPPIRRGRGRGQFSEESEGQNEGVQHSVPRRGRDRQIDLGQFSEESEGQNEGVQHSVPRRGRDRQIDLELYSFVLAGSPASYAEAVYMAIDIEEGLQNRRSRIRPQGVQGSHPVVPTVQSSQSVQSSQPPQQQQQLSQQSGHLRFRPRGRQFKKNSGPSSSGPGIRAVAIARRWSIVASVVESTRQHSVLVCRVRAMFVVSMDILLECVLCLDRSIPPLHHRVEVDRIEVVLFQPSSRG